jgi:hypothetical protein
MPTQAECCAETDFIGEQFARLAEVQSVHILFRDDTCFITVAVPTKDYDLENRIYDLQDAIAREIRGLLLDINIVVLAGRKLKDVVTPTGHLILDRAA